MITSLTKKQEALLPVWRDKWIKIGLCCDPCNVQAAKRYARMAYKAAGLQPPTRWVVADSPLSGVLASRALGKAPVWVIMRTSVRVSVLRSVLFAVRDSMLGSVRAAVLDSVLNSALDASPVSVRDSMLETLQASIGGSHDAAVLSFYDYFRTVCHLPVCKKLNGIIGVAMHCGWWPIKIFWDSA